MSMTSWILNAYLHRLPDFRGKWRLLTPFAKILDGTPVRSRYSGVVVGIDVRDRTNQLGVLGKYGATVPTEIEGLAEGHCFIDVGANCGIFSLLAADRVGSTGLVLAFEPCFETFAKLVRNISLNGSRHPLPFNIAIGTVTKPDLLDRSSKGHSGKYAIAAVPGEDCEPVTSLSLDDFPGLLKIVGDRPIMIKIDVEGFEYSVLQGLSPLLEHPNTCKVIVEVDDRNLGRYGVDRNDVYALLERRGFRRIVDTDGTRHFDAVFSRDFPDSLAAAAQPEDEISTRRRARVSTGGWSRHVMAIAASLLILALGWGTVKATMDYSAAGDEERFVEEALQSHNIAQTRTRLRRSPPAQFDMGGMAAAAKIIMPHLPPEWRVSEVQLLSYDSGPALQLLITRDGAEPLSLFTARDDDAVHERPDVVTRGGQSIAYWQEGEQAYALVGRRPPGEMDKLAEDLADDQSL